MKHKRFHLIIVLIAGLMIVAGLIIKPYDPLGTYYSPLIRFGSIFGFVFGLIILIYNSSIFETKYWRIFKILIGIVLLTGAYKLLHLPFSNILLILAFYSFPIVYFFRFSAKKEKKLLDVLKLLYICSICFLFPLLLGRILPQDYGIISVACIWVINIYFLIIWFRSFFIKN